MPEQEAAELKLAIARDQFEAAIEAWYRLLAPEGPLRSSAAGRVVHWKRVLEELGAL